MNTNVILMFYRISSHQLIWLLRKLIRVFNYLNIIIDDGLNLIYKLKLNLWILIHEGGSERKLWSMRCNNEWSLFSLTLLFTLFVYESIHFLLICRIQRRYTKQIDWLRMEKLQIIAVWCISFTTNVAFRLGTGLITSNGGIVEIVLHMSLIRFQRPRSQILK